MAMRMTKLDVHQAADEFSGGDRPALARIRAYLHTGSPNNCDPPPG